jgi:hypothetical protein
VSDDEMLKGNLSSEPQTMVEAAFIVRKSQIAATKLVMSAQTVSGQGTRFGAGHGVILLECGRLPPYRWVGIRGHLP